MSQITLRKLPENVERQIRRIARETGTSINKTIIDLLKKSLGLRDTDNKMRDLSDLAGAWSEEEVREFEENTQVFEHIDEEIWRT
jgi:hypothetical protein